MRSTIVRAACALAVSLPLSVSAVVSVAGSASADQARLNDPHGDVYKVAKDGTQGDVPQGEVPNTDISRTVVRHGTGAVGFTVTYVDLKKHASAFISYDAEIKVPHQGTFHALVTVDPGLKTAGLNLTDGHYESVDCARAVAVVHEDEGRLLARVPRSCLGRPDWIRFGASALSLTRAGAKKAYVDNALSTGGTLTKKLYAG